MPSISFGLLQANYPQRHSVPTTALYESIGHPEKLAIPGWENTCAVRVSLALVRSGIAISPGFLTIKAGRNKGARIESRQKHLSDFLVRRWGAPEKFTNGTAAEKAIGQRRGLISFYQLWGQRIARGILT